MKRRLLLSFVVLVVVMLMALEIPCGVLFARHERASLTAQAALDAARVSNSPIGRSGVVQQGRSATKVLITFDDRGRVILSRSNGNIDPRQSREIATDIPLGVVAAIEGRSTSEWIDDGGQSWVYATHPTAGGAVAVGLASRGVDERIETFWAALVAFTLGVALFAGWQMNSWLERRLIALSELTEAGVSDPREE